MTLMPKIVRGSATHVLEQIVRLACALWITPRMVYYLGESGFGLWVLLTGIFGQFILLDLGLSTAIPRFLARAMGRHDDAAIRGAASTGAVAFGVIAAAAFLVGVSVWFSLPSFLPEEHRLHEARSVVVALMVSSLAFWAGRPIVVHLQSRLRRDLMSAAAILRVLICTPLVGLALHRGHGLSTVAWIHTLGGVGEVALMALWDRSFFSLLSRRHVGWQQARELFSFSRWTYVMTTSERLRSGVDPFILASYLNSSASGIYALGQRLALMFYDVAYAFTGTQLLSAFSHLDGTREREKLELGFIAASRFAALMAALGGGMLWSIGPAFLARWIPEQAEAATPVLMCLILPNILYAAQIPSMHLLVSLAKHRSLAWTYLGGLVVNLTLSILLARQFGIIGAALGTAIEMTLVYTVAMPWLVVHSAGMSWRAVLWRGLWQPLLRAALVLSLPLLAVRQWMVIQDYWHVAVAISALGAGFIVAVWSGLLGREEREWLQKGLAWLRRRRAKKTAASTPD
jgi:O-antigen/teichoic acid export membrane protein